VNQAKAFEIFFVIKDSLSYVSVILDDFFVYAILTQSHEHTHREIQYLLSSAQMARM